MRKVRRASEYVPERTSAIKPGSWRPATLVRSDLVTLKWLLAVFAVFRAVDYATSATSARDSGGVETLVHPLLWTGFCSAVALSLVVGLTWRIHYCVWLGHALGAVLYSALAVGAAQYAFSFTPPDEWRRIGPLAVMAYVHFMFAIRSGPRPIGSERNEAEVTVERAVAPKES